MSDPSETSGRPLVSSNLQPEQIVPSTAQRPSSAHSESGTSSPAPTELPDVKRSFKAHRRSGSSKGGPSKLQPASSRSKQRSTASPTAMASSPSSVNYTRTGRVSKAKKGLKVHNCENCGRSYTRAEHLRRHQKNHAQDGALACDFPNCDKTFFRIDLLQRHQERHNDPERMSRHTSVFSPESSPEARQTSAPETTSNDTAATLPAAQPFHTPPPPSPVQSPTLTRYNTNPFRTPQLPRASQAPTSVFKHVVHSSPSLMSRNQKQHHGPFVSRRAVGVPMLVDDATSGFGWADFHCQSPSYSSSDGYVSPNPAMGDHGTGFGYSNLPYCPEPLRTRTSSNASFIEPPWSYASCSPASTTSTMAYTWAASDKISNPSSLAYNNGTIPMASIPNLNGVDPTSSFCHYGPKTVLQRDDEESVYLFGEPLYGMMGPTTHTSPFEQDLDCYWRFCHPTFPVVHRPTFRLSTATPMLLAAMTAVGGQYSSKASVKRKARDMHDRCVKMLERREQDTMTEPERLQDYQATFLIEIVSQFRSRRSSKVLTGRFAKVYSKTFLDFQNTTTRVADLVSSLNQSDNTATDQWAQWIDLISRQRLLQACYILETQQAMLLARDPIPSLIHACGYDLPLPVPLLVFDAESPNEWKSASQLHGTTVQSIFEFSPALLSTPLDAFQSSMLIAATYNQLDPSEPYVFRDSDFDLGHCINTSASTFRQYLAAKLVRITPIRALLAISGESWIFSEKVPTVQAFSGLRTTLRTWVAQLWATNGTHSDTSPVQEALQLSVAILEAALKEQQNPTVPEVGTDLSIFYAALVLWAITTAAGTRFGTIHQRSKLPMNRHQPSQSLPLTPMAASSITSSPQSSLYQSLGQSSSAVNTASSPTLRSFTSMPVSPLSQTSHDSTCSLSHAQITINTITFLSSALVDFGDGASQSWKRSDLARCQNGCMSLLLWVKLRVRGVSLGDGSADAWSGDSGESLGELLNGITTMLEKMLGRGWSGWGI